MGKYLNHYLSQTPKEQRDDGAVGFMASLDSIATVEPKVTESIIAELQDQRNQLKMIASENYCSLPVQLAMGNLLTDKYSEGYVHHRFYAGCENVDNVEELANEKLKKLFGCEHAYVQPHSGADANLVAFWAILVTRIQDKELERIGENNLNKISEEDYQKIRHLLVNQKMMGMALNAGGHLTHGYRLNISSKMMQAHTYDVDKATHLLDYAQIEKQAMEVKPLIMIAGYSAYPRLIDFAKMREIADKCGTTLMVDMAHFAGLVAGGVMKGNYNPIPFAHVVTSTTHKTLRGPRGGIVMCTDEYKAGVDKGCPIVLGGPLPHVMAAKALAFEEALQPSYSTYAHQIVKNAQALADQLLKRGANLVTGGTDNHLMVVDVLKTFGLNGRHAENALREANITVNRNTVPFDENGPWYTSGIRIGTPALTSRGLKEDEMRAIGDLIFDILSHVKPKQVENSSELSKNKVKFEKSALDQYLKQVADILGQYPLYPELAL
ncbi:MAG: glycine hydroxymethyltransferase [Rhabdochlamydiaceae bacterium]|nr:glycine hydroxymethyltransferase [Candidatus Amphrikana amoebophyrae]